MQRRYVVVPAVSVEKEIFPRRVGIPSAAGEGYDLYDTEGKIRLSLSIPTRAEADYECSLRNDDQGSGGSCAAGIGWDDYVRLQAVR